ncbi:ABC transporter ATP-binding protein [Veillonella agrestimuris]|uniref:ABC transporter ATP-binding protein n=1 Tax=Veillonella agrestimuris TaxID=2941340 RepID=UPI00203E0BC5|nr:ABC transporter ATP-binding protein [Veillonella agrestimuris]
MDQHNSSPLTHSSENRSTISESPAVTVKHVSITLGERQILHDISLAIPKGKITTLIGPNGCGKSTLLRTMIGHIWAHGRDNISIFDKSLNRYKADDLAKVMAFLPQSPDIPKDMTVEELVYCGRYPYQRWWQNTAEEDRTVVDRVLDITKTNHLRDQLIPSLSGGERQRVWIAMALAQEPKLLVLDEPTTYLDINHQLEIMELLKRLNEEEGLTVLMVLHDLTQALQYSDYMAVLQDGRLITSGYPQDVMTEDLLQDVFRVHGSVDVSDKKGYVKITGLL